jgi:predicted amidohydrolase YtcJ
LHHAGAILAFGSDVPVETMDPIAGLCAAVNRQDHDGEPRRGWYPAQRLTVRQALHAYTVGAAIAGGRGGRMGRLRVGLPADIVLLSADPCAVPRGHLRDLEVVGTLLGGQTVYGP